jgi:hypothetical protein
MGTESSLLWGMVFGAFGLGYFIYGKKQKMIMALICGMDAAPGSGKGQHVCNDTPL